MVGGDVSIDPLVYWIVVSAAFVVGVLVGRILFGRTR
jgi:hypothetical protein